MSNAEQILNGMLLIGEVMPVLLGKSNDAKAVQIMTMVLMGRHDQLLLATFFFRDTRRYATEEDLKSPVATVPLDRLKSLIRAFIQGVFDAESAAEEERKRQALQKLVNEQRAHNQPHPEGTVDQLAAKYGVSKSEIRRRKAAGTLGELLNKE